jgi:tRNA A-37 threonylcarbamoyl transferase component Bud32
VQLAGYARVTSPDFRGDPGRPESWLERRGDVLPEMPGRRVFRADISGQHVVIKEFTPQRLRHWLRPYAANEAENALALRARGIAVVEPLAVARLRDGRQIVVLREEEGALSLHHLVLGGACRGRARHELARKVGELFAALHNAGVRNRDPHAGNVLVRPDGSVLFADAGGLDPGDYLTPDERARSLASFALFFLTHGNAVDRLLFWGAYGRGAESTPEELEDLRQRVQARIPAAFRRLARTRARRRQRTGRRIEAGSFLGTVFEGIDVALVEEAAAFAARLQEGPNVLKKSPTAWTFTLGEDFVAKVYLPKKATRPLKDLLCGTRAEHALLAEEALFHRGFRGAQVVAVLKDRDMPGRSLLVMRREREALPLEVAAEAFAPREARAAAVRLGRTLRRMHDLGLRHRDLKKDNVLVTPDGRDFVFLDLDGVRESDRALDGERRAKDLATLGGSLLDSRRVPLGLRLRTLDAYLGGETPEGFGPGGFTRLVLRLAAEAQERRRAAASARADLAS